MPQQLKEGLIGKKIMDQERRWEENELSHEIWVCVPVEMGMPWETFQAVVQDGGLGEIQRTC